MNTHPINYFLHSLDTGAIEVVLVPSSLDEQVGLDVPLHLLHGHKVVVPPVHLPLTRLTSCVYMYMCARDTWQFNAHMGEKGTWITACSVMSIFRFHPNICTSIYSADIHTYSYTYMYAHVTIHFTYVAHIQQFCQGIPAPACH